MLSTSDIVTWINQRVCEIIPGLKSYGIATVAVWEDTLIPHVDGRPVSIDDIHPAMLYHKQLSIASSIVPGSGYGDDERSLQNTWGMVMIMYFDESCMPVDSLYSFVQSAITGVLMSEGLKSTRVNVASANLSDTQVWRQEYGASPYKLSGSKRLIQINYTIVTVFNKSCIKIPQCLNN